MTDQYIDTAEAVRRLSARIPNQDVVEHYSGDAPPEFWNPASVAWKKHELAVALLYAAFCEETLATVMRSKVGLVPLIGSEWRTLVYWREVILGGRMRTSIGEEVLASYDECVVLVSVQSFAEWLEQRRSSLEPPPSQPAAASLTLLPETPTVALTDNHTAEPAATNLTLTSPAPEVVRTDNHTEERLSPRVQAVMSTLDAMEREQGTNPDAIHDDRLLEQVRERVSFPVGKRTLQSALAARRRRSHRE